MSRETHEGGSETDEYTVGRIAGVAPGVSPVGDHGQYAHATSNEIVALTGHRQAAHMPTTASQLKFAESSKISP
ncbi:MAG: hypothetical protein KGM47_07015 [Acidobacteriota bacterium]|nr:hypothetical protein [Acidobacteriota bacterium]